MPILALCVSTLEAIELNILFDLLACQAPIVRNATHTQCWPWMAGEDKKKRFEFLKIKEEEEEEEDEEKKKKKKK